MTTTQTQQSQLWHVFCGGTLFASMKFNDCCLARVLHCAHCVGLSVCFCSTVNLDSTEFFGHFTSKQDLTCPPPQKLISRCTCASSFTRARMSLFASLASLWTPTNFFYYSFIAGNLVQLWDTYLHYRQHKVYNQKRKVPVELAPYVDEDNFSKARIYNLDKSNFGFIRDLFGLLQKNLFLWIFLPAKIWGIATYLTPKLFGYEDEIISTMLFFFLQSSLSTIIDLPFSLYSNFVIEERHGFNKYTLKFFIWDTIKKFLVFQPIISMLIGGSTYIIIRFENQFFLYLWLFSSSMAIIFMIIYPSVIAPLFDKYTQLEDGTLRTRIEKLAVDIHFPLKNIYVVDGSKRSSHSNAYFYGVFKSKQIVLYDTLFEKKEGEKKSDESKDGEKENLVKEGSEKPAKKSGCSEKEIVAIICHELGHWNHSHVYKNLLISLANMFLIFKTAAIFYKDPVIYEAFGFFGPNKPCFIGLLLVIENIFLIYFEIFNFAMSLISRKFEFQADDFAKNLNFRTELINALIKLNKDNLSFPVYDWLYSALLHSHPPILDRINALKKID